jgi:hypothetical protein
MIDIVICVDGTNSQDYKNRSVENFCRSVQADIKIYKKGPQHGATGSDWTAIRDEVVRELNVVAKRLGEESFFNGYECTIGRSKQYRFIMAGHSRGGHIVINLAAMLRYRTHFMGLYDAVDRTNPFDIHQKALIYNVDHIYHATRDVSVGSRTTKKLQVNYNTWLLKGIGMELADYGLAKMLDFDNTGLGSGDGGEYVQRSFKTSHGGIGGDVLTHTLVSVPVAEPLFADDSCAISMFNQSETQVRKMEVCLADSVEADRFIRAGARKCGVRI